MLFKMHYMKHLLLTSLAFSFTATAFAQINTLQPVGFSQVKINDAFWTPRQETVTKVTIPVCIDQTEVKTPRIRNFEKVARNDGEKHEGIYFDDSDVYKAMEAMAYSLKNHPDAALEAKFDQWTDIIAKAQQPDGYLNTYYTLGGLQNRWTDMERHEDYCAGHLIEAAVAYYNATGKTKLLNVATRFADHIDSTFRQTGRHWVSGHEEIELALVKLYKTTHNKRYLDLADWYLQQRGHGYGRGGIWRGGSNADYCQDGTPVADQKEITGHAVRAMYLYTGAADVGAAKQDTGYMKAMKTVWQDVVYRNMYLTGGIGSSGHNEGFTKDYDLPNEDAYCETCASVGMVFWNQRMNLLTGESKYIDVLERSLYNGALDGLSLSGDHFFYGNPLANEGNYARSEWFGTACCPSNIARLVESLGDYIYAKDDNDIWVNLFIGSSTDLALKKGSVSIVQATKYPWQGDVQITVTPVRSMAFPLHVRIPGWAMNEPVPGNAYRFVDDDTAKFTITVNGKPAKYNMEAGYAVLNQTWKKGDVVELHLPMQVRKVAANYNIVQDRNRVALQRGPLVYCVEHPDNDGSVYNMILPVDAQFTTAYRPDLLNGVMTIEGQVPVFKPSANGEQVVAQQEKLTAIPYYAWANRGKGEMEVWLPTKVASVKVAP